MCSKRNGFGGNKFRVTACLLATLMTAAPSFADSSNNSNRQTSDALFNEPRGSAINQLMLTAGDIVAFYIVRPRLPESKALTDAEANMKTIVASDASPEAKMAELNRVQTEYSSARLAALKATGALDGVIRSARVVGSTLVLVDIAGRAWVWGALRANPTWSPAATALVHLSGKISSDKALPEK